MSDKTRRDVSKLLRVLVAGGMALAGASGIRAEDQGAAPTEKTEKAKEKEQEKELERAKAEKAEKEQQKKKGDEKKKKEAQSDGGGVPGW